MYVNFPAKSTVCTLHMRINLCLWPTLSICLVHVYICNTLMQHTAPSCNIQHPPFPNTHNTQHPHATYKTLMQHTTPPCKIHTTHNTLMQHTYMTQHPNATHNTLMRHTTYTICFRALYIFEYNFTWTAYFGAQGLKSKLTCTTRSRKLCMCTHNCAHCLRTPTLTKHTHLQTHSLTKHTHNTHSPT